MKKIDKIFLKTKSMPLDLFLEKTLYDRKVGYYQKKNPFGIKGDYITAPNVSNIFCEMVAIWVVSFWENIKWYFSDRMRFPFIISIYWH